MRWGMATKFTKPTSQRKPRQNSATPVACDFFKYWNRERTLWECTRFGFGLVLFCFPSRAAERKYLSQTAGLAFSYSLGVSGLPSPATLLPASVVHTCDWVWSEPKQMPVCQRRQLRASVGSCHVLCEGHHSSSGANSPWPQHHPQVS